MRHVLLLSWLLCGCSPVAESDPSSPDPRIRLGIPPEARTVIVFGQTAHLDLDWQKTFTGYYQAYVGDIFLEARQILEQQPHAFYSVAEMAYLEHHVQVHPEEQARLAALAGRGQLRVVGGGMTSPDTLLPETELLLRDFLHGSLVAEEVLSARAHAAWLPDSFGHAATAPDVLAAAGFDSVAFARVDGAPTFYEAILGHDRARIKPGSTAQLLQQLGSADFIWRGPGGGTVLAHYLSSPGLYCAGDNIDYDEVITPPGGHFGTFKGDDPHYIDQKIDGYVQALQPYAKTPFLFVPVGCDFQHPKQQLLDYLAGYNQRHYAQTGTLAVTGTFEDYAQLVLGYRDQLPEMAADLTPYFMGFYGSRADVKQHTRQAARPFFAAEPFAVALGDEGATLMRTAAPALRKLTWTDHHDFVTGTSADEVVMAEQLPLLGEAEGMGMSTLSGVAAALAQRIPQTAGAVGRLLALNPAAVPVTATSEANVAFAPPLSDLQLYAVSGKRSIPLEVIGSVATGTGYSSVKLRLQVADLPPLSWRAIDLFPGQTAPARPLVLQLLDDKGQPAKGPTVVRVLLQNEHVRARFDRTPGGFVLSSLQLDSTEALSGPSFTLRDYTDMGGLWRLGNEMPGCSLTPVPPGPGPGMGEVAEVLGSSDLSASVAFRSGDTVREAALTAGAKGLLLALTTGAAQGTTRTASFSFAVGDGAPLRTSLAGGFAERTPERLYTPTFWPAVAWLTSGDLAVLLRQSTGVRFGTTGAVELLAARNAVSEQCDVEGGKGTDPGLHRIEWRIERAADPAAAEQAAQAFNRPLQLFAVPPGTKPAPMTDLPLERSLVQAEGSGVISALKPADRGQGVILRVLLLPGPVTLHLPPPLGSSKVMRADAAECDLGPVSGTADGLTLDQKSYGAIVTLRLLP